MSPLQRVAMGLLVVFASATWPPDPSPSWARYDLLADPVGWGLVLWGTSGLARAAPGASGGVRAAAGVAGLVSLPLFFPQLRRLLDASTEWAVSLPQLVFCLLLARWVAGAAAEHDEPRVARRFTVLSVGLGLVAVLPVVVLGGGVTALVPAVALLALVVDVALVWSLFAVHRRTWLGGPGSATAARPHVEGDGRHEPPGPLRRRPR